MKRIIVAIIVAFLFALPVRADEVYSEQYEISGADGLYGALPQETQDYFDENGIDLSDENWVSNLSGENVFRPVSPAWIFPTGLTGMKTARAS